MEKTNIQDTDDIIEDISEETLLSLDENLEQDQETSEIAKVIAKEAKKTNQWKKLK